MPRLRLYGLYWCLDIAHPGKLLPPFLFLLKPPPTPAAGSSAVGGPGKNAGSRVAGGAAAAAAAAAARDVVLLPPAGSSLSNMIRGTLALLLRTCSAANPQDNYLALAVAAGAPGGTPGGAAVAAVAGAKVRAARFNPGACTLENAGEAQAWAAGTWCVGGITA